MAKIMLVEDDNNLREIYGARLLAEGHEIVAAKDGEEALAIAVKEKPDLIISDVMMPKISGFDMLDILRNAPETKYTKVIMMTALSQAEDKARADSLGADRYLVKSQVTLEDVARVVRDVLEGKTPDQPSPAVAEHQTEANETTASTEAQATEPSEAVAPTAPATELAIPEPAAPEAPQAEIAPTAPTPVLAEQPEQDLSAPEIDSSAAPAVQPAQAVQTPDPVQAIADDTQVPSEDSLAAIIDPPEPEVNEAPIETPPMPSEPGPAEAPTPEEPGVPAPEASQGSAIDNAIANLGGTTGVSTSPNTATDDNQQPAPESVPPVTQKIEVTLPDSAITSPSPTPEAAITNPAEAPTPEEPDTAESPDAQIGANLDAIMNQEINDASNAETPPVNTEDQTDTVINGVQNPVITPTEAQAEPAAPETTETEKPAEAAEGQEEQPASNPLNDDSSGIKKKIVIQPINDITKGPDMNALLEAEEKKAAVVNPGANSIITPTTDADQPTSDQPDAPEKNTQNQPPNEHDVIAL